MQIFPTGLSKDQVVGVATVIGTVAGVTFYEHPQFGDECPLIIVVDNKIWRTDFWELPTAEEMSGE